MLLFWIGVGIFFLIIELLMATFYGFSIAIAAFSVAGYVAVMGGENIDIIQATIFVVSALVWAYIFPKILTPKTKNEKPQGLDIYIGETHKIRRVGEDYKISLDGVPYVVISDDELRAGDLVTILERKGSVFIVQKK